LQGVGYPAANLSHFRSIEIWDTASASDAYLQDGWLTRAFAAAPPPRAFAADGVIIGTNDLGPLAGGGTRAIALSDTDRFVRQAKLATPAGDAHNKAFQCDGAGALVGSAFAAHTRPKIHTGAVRQGLTRRSPGA
jgi:uncharacterized protein (DUF1501 family)